MFETIKEFFMKKGTVALSVGVLSLGSVTVGYNQGCFHSVSTDTTPAPVAAPATP